MSLLSPKTERQLCIPCRNEPDQQRVAEVPVLGASLVAKLRISRKDIRMRSISRESKLGTAIADCNWEYVTHRIRDRFDCEFDQENVAKSLEAERKSVMDSVSTHEFGAGWKDSTWFIWLKSRIKFERSDPLISSVTSSQLHFFFITIPEDMKMLGRLHEDSWVPLDTTARSRISSSQYKKASPVNHTASLVVRGT